MTTKTVKEIEDQIRALICEGLTAADETGEHFRAGGEEYIPASSPEYDDYEWVRDEYCIPEGEGFWFNSSMSC
ncbi:hypothetical protein MN01_00081 [Escherichia phage MN01]|nr:hypothetical protein MN01_00081 [Escherichia phage MN01]